MFQRPLPPVLTDDGTSLTVVARYPWAGCAVVTNVWWTNTNTAVTSIIHFYLHSIYIDDLHRSLLMTSVLWRCYHHAPLPWTRPPRPHTPPIPAASSCHRAVASRLQPIGPFYTASVTWSYRYRWIRVTFDEWPWTAGHEGPIFRLTSIRTVWLTAIKYGMWPMREGCVITKSAMPLQQVSDSKRSQIFETPTPILFDLKQPNST